MSSDGVTSADACVGHEQHERECNRFECPGKNEIFSVISLYMYCSKSCNCITGNNEAISICTCYRLH